MAEGQESEWNSPSALERGAEIDLNQVLFDLGYKTGGPDQMQESLREYAKDMEENRGLKVDVEGLSAQETLENIIKTDPRVREDLVVQKSGVTYTTDVETGAVTETPLQEEGQDPDFEGEPAPGTEHEGAKKAIQDKRAAAVGTPEVIENTGISLIMGQENYARFESGLMDAINGGSFNADGNIMEVMAELMQMIAELSHPDTPKTVVAASPNQAGLNAAGAKPVEQQPAMEGSKPGPALDKEVAMNTTGPQLLVSGA